MAKSINKVILIGNVGKDPEVKTFQNGAVLNVSLATTDSYKDKEGQQKDSTQWHRLVFFNKLADIGSKYIKKGSLIYVEGNLKTRKWADKVTGKDTYATEIHVKEMQLLSSKKEENKDEIFLEYRGRETETEELYNDDIPF